MEPSIKFELISSILRKSCNAFILTWPDQEVSLPEPRCHLKTTVSKWHTRRDSNSYVPVLETGAQPIGPRAYK